MTSNTPARFALRVCFLLTLFACASRPPPASQEEIKQANREYASCLHRAAVDLDDGATDAASVASKVGDYCAPEYQRVVDLQSQDMKPAAKKAFTQKAQASQLDDATAAVQQERSQPKAPTQ
jgi:hypothetical protein